MTIEEIKAKIKELNAELDNAGNGYWWPGRHPSHIAVEIIACQEGLIKKLEG